MAIFLPHGSGEFGGLEYSLVNRENRSHSSRGQFIPSCVPREVVARFGLPTSAMVMDPTIVTKNTPELLR